MTEAEDILRMVEADFDSDDMAMLNKRMGIQRDKAEDPLNLMKGEPKDPTKQEMMLFLRDKYAGLLDPQDLKDSAEIAIYWFSNHHHGGQASNLYGAASTSPYRPGPMMNLDKEDETIQDMYTDLMLEYSPEGADWGSEINRQMRHLFGDE